MGRPAPTAPAWVLHGEPSSGRRVGRFDPATDHAALRDDARAVLAVWAIVMSGMIVGTFEPMPDLPEVAYRLSAFAHPAQPPIEPLAALPLLAPVGITAGAVALGVIGLRRHTSDAVGDRA